MQTANPPANIALLAMLLAGCSDAPASPDRPINVTIHHIEDDWTISVNDNGWDRIQLEVATPEFHRYVERRSGQSIAEYGDVSVRYARMDRDDWIHRPGSDDNPVEAAIGEYVWMRRRGHTRAFVFQATGDEIPAGIPAQIVAAIEERRGPIPSHWLVPDGSAVDSDGQTVHRYHLLDGELAWVFSVSQGADGTTRLSDLDKTDAVEHDPRFKTIIAAADADAAALLDEQGIRGQIGSVWVYWDRKKQFLRERGIEWKSPADLNPGTIYD